MKVAISTMQPESLFTNYGTFFQHYALRQVLKNFGKTPFRLERSQNFIFKDILRPFVVEIRSFKKKKFSSLGMIRRILTYYSFLKDYKKLIGRINDIQDFNDAIGIMGSDQIMGALDGKTWLNDIKAGRRFSYAASADWLSLRTNEEWRDCVAENSERFLAIGVREEKGCEILKNIVGNKEVACVADPVMLLSKMAWTDICKKINHRNNVFVYMVNCFDCSDLRYQVIADFSSKIEKRLINVGVQGSENFLPMGRSSVLSPIRFLSEMRDSAFVVTNSFHGTLFALVLNKPFVSIKQRVYESQNIRQFELLSRVGLLDRLLSFDFKAEQLEDMFAREIDWNKVNQKVSDYRNYSMSWLENCLKKAENSI